MKAIHTVHDAVLQLPVSVCRSGKLIYSFRLCAALVVVHLSSFYCKHVVYIYNEEDKSVQQPKLLVEGEMYTKMPDYWQGYVLSFRPNFQIS